MNPINYQNLRYPIDTGFLLRLVRFSFDDLLSVELEET